MSFGELMRAKAGTAGLPFINPFTQAEEIFPWEMLSQAFKDFDFDNSFLVITANFKPSHAHDPSQSATHN